MHCNDELSGIMFRLAHVVIMCSTILCSHAVPQLTLPNITKYIPQILEIKAASLEEQLAVKDAPASSVELVLSAWLAGKGAPHSWKRLIWALDIIENKRRYKGPQSVADNIRKFAEPPQGMIIMHDCIVSLAQSLCDLMCVI